MRATVRSLIEKNFYIPQDEALSDEDSLLDRGIIDSTGVLELISALEQEFGIEVGDDEIIPKNLDSIAHIEAFITRKRATAA